MKEREGIDYGGTKRGNKQASRSMAGGIYRASDQWPKINEQKTACTCLIEKLDALMREWRWQRRDEVWKRWKMPRTSPNREGPVETPRHGHAFPGFGPTFLLTDHRRSGDRGDLEIVGLFRCLISTRECPSDRIIYSPSCVVQYSYIHPWARLLHPLFLYSPKGKTFLICWRTADCQVMRHQDRGSPMCDNNNIVNLMYASAFLKSIDAYYLKHGRSKGAAEQHTYLIRKA